jgi:hypothetical protein
LDAPASVLGTLEAIETIIFNDLKKLTALRMPLTA